MTPPQAVSATTSTTATPTFKGRPQTFSLRGGLTTQQPTASKEVAPTSPAPQTITEVRPFTEHELCHEWRYFLNSLPREYAATTGRLKNIEPKLVKEWTGHIVFESQPVADCFLSIKQQMLDFIRTRLRNAQVDFTFEIEELAEPTKVKTPREHWAELLQNNQMIQRLQKGLGLEYC